MSPGGNIGHAEDGGEQRRSVGLQCAKWDIEEMEQKGQILGLLKQTNLKLPTALSQETGMVVFSITTWDEDFIWL